MYDGRYSEESPDPDMSEIDQRPDVPVSLDLDQNQDGVKLRRDGDTLRRVRERKKERTPTAIVSDAFTFLNDHQISIVDAVEEGSLKTEGGIHNKELDDLDGKDSCNESVETESTLDDSDHFQNDKCLPLTDCHFSKDSGFASLERHLHCDNILSFGDSQDDMLGGETAPQTHLQGSSGGDCTLDNEMNLNVNFQHSVEKNDTDSKIEDIPFVSTSQPKPDDKDNLSDTVSENVEIGSNDVNYKLSIYVEKIEREIQQIEIANQNEDDREKVSENMGDIMLNHSENGHVISEEDSTCTPNSKTEYDVHDNSDHTDTNICDVSEDKSAENTDNVCNKSVTNVDKNGEFSFVVTDSGENEISSKDIEAEDRIESVDMRKKPDVIPASPLKSPSYDASSRSSKSGLLLKANPATDLASDDSSDEDTGIYAESFRRSNWVRVSQEKKRKVRQPSPNRSPMSLRSSRQATSPSILSEVDSSNSVVEDRSSAVDNGQDDVFTEPVRSLVGQKLCHKRSDSVTTTASEQEFQTRYISRRKCLIQRADSQQEYHRLSARVYGEDKEVVLERTSESEDLGLHLLDSHPTYITSVDADSPAERAGIVEGQILVTVNDFNVLLTDHNDIIKLIQDCKGALRLGVASTDYQPIRDLQAPVISGHMYKLGTSNIVRMWKKRFFILRNDNCLYYYKSDQDLDPLGALPLAGYTISRHTDTSKDFCFKAEKYRARTYYFMTENRDQLTEWVAGLTEAAVRSKKQKESSSFMSVSSHNVSLPALDIRRPECSGNLNKLSPHSRSWRRRYCLLKDACIYYYKDINSFSALGVAHLHGYTVDVAGNGKKKNSFSLRPPDAKMRQFNFAADNETEKKRWVEAIIHSIQRWVPVEKNSDC